MAHSNDEGVKTASSRRKKGVFYGIKNTSFGESRYYLFEYGLLLLLTTVLLAILVGMIQAFFSTVTINSLFSYTFSDTYVILLSGLTIVLPLVIILIQRTAESEHHNPSIKNLAWRKGFLGVFLAAVSIGAVVSSILFINSILGYLSLDILTKSDFDWQTTVRYLASTILLVLTAWTFGNDYRYIGKDHFAGLRHRYRYGLVIASVVVGFLFLVFPFRENRMAMVDQMIVNDLSDIHSGVIAYNTKNNRLPNAISELSLSKDQTLRASTYVYTIEKKSGSGFELCANFNLNAPEPKSNDQLVPMSSTTGGTDFYTELNSHTSGRDCFESVDQSAASTSSSNIQQEVDGSYVQTFQEAPSDSSSSTDAVDTNSAQ